MIFLWFNFFLGLEPIMAKMASYGNDPLTPVLVDLFKYYKYRINYENYKVPLNEMFDFGTLLLTEEVEIEPDEEEELDDEPLTDELVDELLNV